MLERVIFSVAISVLAASLGAAAISTAPPRIVDIRVGRHLQFDRLVIELERAAEVREARVQEDGSVVLQLDARPLLPHQTLETSLPRLGAVQIEAAGDGARIRVGGAPHRVRAYRLEHPPRIVLDLADPGPGPFAAPEGVHVVPVQAAVSAPSPGAEAVEAAGAAGTGPAEMSGEDGGPGPPPELSSAPLEQSRPAAEPADETGEAPAPESPHAGTGMPGEAPAPAGTRPVEETWKIPVPEAALPQAAPSGTPGAAGSWTRLLGPGVASLALALAALVLGIAGLAWWRMRTSQRRHAAAQARATALARPRPPEVITAEEIGGASERVDILEKRIDEEVRARMHLEEHLKQLQEEIKVLHDRLRRIRRRGEGAG